MNAGLASVKETFGSNMWTLTLLKTSFLSCHVGTNKKLTLRRSLCQSALQVVCDRFCYLVDSLHFKITSFIDTEFISVQPMSLLIKAHIWWEHLSKRLTLFSTERKKKLVTCQFRYWLTCIPSSNGSLVSAAIVSNMTLSVKHLFLPRHSSKSPFKKQVVGKCCYTTPCKCVSIV